MPHRRGVATLPAVAFVALLGVAAGIGGYTFAYAKGGSYLTDDPAACANCHVMRAEYDGWARGPHHGFATCNDCHVPARTALKYAAKVLNGWRHSRAFTTGEYPDVIYLRDSSRAVIEAQCRRCHADLVQATDLSCIRCHDSVGHLR